MQVSIDELTTHLKGKIQARSTMCLDGHMSHDSLGKKLKVTLKTLGRATLNLNSAVLVDGFKLDIATD